MIFAVTEKGTFKRCPRQAVLTSKNGRHLAPIFTPLRFSVGTIMHRAQQLWLLNPAESLVSHAMTASTELQDRTVESYKKATGVAPSRLEMDETLGAIDIALSMAENYQVKWGRPLPDEYKLIKPEQKVLVPVEATRHNCPNCYGRGETTLTRIDDGHEVLYWGHCPECDGTGEEVHYLSGRLDAFIMHKSGRIDVLERKTYNARPKEDSLKTNDQFLNYMWLLWSLGITDQIPCVAYDGMWRRREVPRGRTFDDLFLRVIVTRNKHELDELARFLPAQLNAMAAIYRNPENADINRRWEGCWDCSVENICRSMSRGEDTRLLIATNYTTRTDDLDEEEGDSSD